jgi:hypothetical protein
VSKYQDLFERFRDIKLVAVTAVAKVLLTRCPASALCQGMQGRMEPSETLVFVNKVSPPFAARAVALPRDISLLFILITFCAIPCSIINKFFVWINSGALSHFTQFRFNPPK